MSQFKLRTLEALNYFVGRVCSIITTSMNRSFEEKIAREHFVIRVEEVSVDGIWGTHPYNPSLLSFFNFTHVISIQEEEVLDPTDPDHKKMIEDFESKTGKKLKSDLGNVTHTPLKQSLPVINNPPKEKGDSIFVSIDNLEELAENTRKNYEVYEKFRSNS